MSISRDIFRIITSILRDTSAWSCSISFKVYYFLFKLGLNNGINLFQYLYLCSVFVHNNKIKTYDETRYHFLKLIIYCWFVLFTLTFTSLLVSPCVSVINSFASMRSRTRICSSCNFGSNSFSSVNTNVPQCMPIDCLQLISLWIKTASSGLTCWFFIISLFKLIIFFFWVLDLDL